MKFSKALEELEAGEKVRQHSWAFGIYLQLIEIYQQKRLNVYDENGFIAEFNTDSRSLLADDWEVVLPEVVCDIVVKCPKCNQEVHLFDEEYEVVNCPCGFQYDCLNLRDEIRTEYNSR